MGGEGHCIYSRLVYKRRGGWVDIWGGRGSPSQGASGRFSCLPGAPQTEMGRGGGKVGYRHQKHMHMTSSAP